jgi:hypothetical protein
VTAAFALHQAGDRLLVIELICRHLLRSEVAASQKSQSRDVEILGQTGLAIDIAAPSC